MADPKTTVSEVMTKNPITLDAKTTVEDAARAMRDADIGDVLVMEDNHLCGIVTDRDIVLRSIAEGQNPGQMPIRRICSETLASASPSDTVEDAVRMMRERSVRRLPVVEGDKPIGILSIGDLAVERDPRSALGEISAAPPNR